MARYLVTGCAGFIGSHLVEALLDRGDEVVGVDAFRTFYARPVKERNVATALTSARFSLAELDLAEESPQLDRVDGVFHLAAQPGVRSSWGDDFVFFVRDNVVATQRLLEAVGRAGIRIVLASTSSVYGDAAAYPVAETAAPAPASPYGVTKLACEHLARSYAASHGVDFVALRYFTVYGPRQRPDMAFSRLVEAARTGRIFRVYGTGMQSRDFTYVADAVAATIAAMERAPTGRTYNVGGAGEARLLEVASLCEALVGRSLNLVYEAHAAGDVRRTAADPSLIRAELGWEPRTALVEGLAAQLEAAGLSVGAARLAERAGVA